MKRPPYGKNEPFVKCVSGDYSKQTHKSSDPFYDKWEINLTHIAAQNRKFS
jgi:hypothetical protein